jgi:hypothetical protein
VDTGHQEFCSLSQLYIHKYTVVGSILVNYEMFTKMNISLVHNILPTTVYVTPPIHLPTLAKDAVWVYLVGGTFVGGLSHPPFRSDSYI